MKKKNKKWESGQRVKIRRKEITKLLSDAYTLKKKKSAFSILLHGKILNVSCMIF